MPAPLAALAPLVKAIGAQAGRTAITTAAKGAAKSVAKNIAKDAVKNKAKNFVTGKGKKKKGKKGKGGALVKSEGGEQKQEGTGGGAIVATTPMVGNYRVETPPEKPEVEGKQSKISFESINNQLDSIAGLTEVLKKTSQARLKTAVNKKKAERKAAEKAKKRQRESLLEKGAGFVGGVAGSVTKALPFDPLKFFTMILLGSLLMWIMQNGSKIIGFLKGTLAFMNALGKLILNGIKSLGKGLKSALKFILKGIPGVGKAANAIKNLFKTVGSKLKGAFNAIGSGLKNMAKGLIKRLKDLGKFILNPQGKKPPKGTPKGLKQAVKPGQLTSNASRAIKLKHGTEAAERFQRLVDKGMDPAKASRKVNKAIKAGKIVSKPAAKAGSKVAQKAGEKTLVTVSKGALKFLKRIPVIGGLITLVVSLLSGDPISQALFKTGGAVLGGFLGSFIPIPVIGTLLGELVGEYIGDLMYHLLMGGGPEAVGQKMKEDIEGLFKTGKAALDWAGDGFKRLMEGLPKFKVPEKILGIPIFGIGGAEVINPLPLVVNPLMVIPKVYKAFFTRDPMGEGVVDETNKDPNEKEKIEYQPGVVTPSTGPGAAPPEPNYSQEPTISQGPGRLAGPVPAGALQIANVKTTYYDPSLGGINASGAKTAGGLPATSTGEGYLPQVFSAAAFPPLLAQLPASMTVPARGFPGGRTLKKPFHLIVTNSEGKKAIIRVNDVGPGVQGHSSNHMLDLSVAAKNYLGTGSGFTIQMAPPNSKSGPLTEQTTSSATTPQVQPTTPMAATPSTGSVTTGSVTPAATVAPRPPTVTVSTGPAISREGKTTGTQKGNLISGFPVTSGYGMRSMGMHKGIDIGTPVGTYVGLSVPVEIVYAGRHGSVGSGYGNVVDAWAPSLGLQFRLAHLNTILCKKGQKLPAGAALGVTGGGAGDIGRGSSTGPHLHFEVDTTKGGMAYGGAGDPSPYVNYIILSSKKPEKGATVTTPGTTQQVTPTTAGSTTTGGSVTTGSGSATVTRSSTAGSGSISAISSQLAYETPGGGGVIMLAPTADNRNMVVGSSGGGAGTPVIMGSGDVVNSYYKAQLLGFLYKQG